MYLPTSLILLGATCFAGLLVLAVALIVRVRRFLALFQYYPDPIIELDGHSRLVSCNKAFAELLGYGSIRECLAFFHEFPHFNSEDFDHISEWLKDGDRIPFKLEKMFTLTQRMGGKVEREIEVFRRRPQGGWDLRIIPLQQNRNPDDLWDRLISRFELPVVLVDVNDRIVGLNEQAKRKLVKKISDKFNAQTDDQRGWFHLSVQGHMHHKIWLLPETGQQTDESKAITQVKANGVNHGTELSRPIAEDYAGAWSVSFTDGKLEQTQALVEMLGYSQVKEVGSAKFWWDCIANADKSQIEEKFENYDAGRTSEFKATFRVADSEGEEHYVEVKGKGTDRDERGRLVSLKGTYRLLSEPKSRDLLPNGTRETVNEADAPIVARGGSGTASGTATSMPRSKMSIRHDLANQLGVVTGYADLLLADPSLSEEIRSFAEAIATAGAEAQECVQEQKYSDPVAVAKQEAEMEAVSRASQFNEGLDRLTVILKGYFDTEATLEGKIHIRDYTVESDPPYCGVCGEMIELGSHAREVFDSRVRLDQQRLPYVTNPAFYSPSRTGSHNLAELARILHQQNGHMSLNADATGVGVTIFTLPKSVTIKTSLETGEFGHPVGHRSLSARQKRARPRILVVDDEELVSSYFAIVLGRAGYDVTTLNKPQLALRYLVRDHQPCDLLITDQNMPEMTGEELCESVRSRRPDLPIILCTGYDSLERKPLQTNLLSQPGIVSVLKKPLDAQELLSVVQTLIVLAANDT